MDNILLSDRLLAHQPGVSRASIWRWVKTGKLPQPILIGERTRRWRAADIECFLESAQPANERKSSTGSKLEGAKRLQS